MLRLAHPFIPFITEELWQTVAPLAAKKGASIMVAPYPSPEPAKIDEKAEAIVAAIKTIVNATRNLRSTMGVSPALKPAGYLADPTPAVKANLGAISAIARVDFHLVDSLPQRDSPSAITESGKVMLHIEIDREAERARLTKEKERAEAEIANAKGKLSNPSFVDRAPAAVVEQERKRLADLENRLAQLVVQLGKLS